MILKNISGSIQEYINSDFLGRPIIRQSKLWDQNSTYFVSTFNF